VSRSSATIAVLLGALAAPVVKAGDGSPDTASAVFTARLNGEIVEGRNGTTQVTTAECTEVRSGSGTVRVEFHTTASSRVILERSPGGALVYRRTLIRALAGSVTLSGEALSHCVGSDDVLVSDCTPRWTFSGYRTSFARSGPGHVSPRSIRGEPVIPTEAPCAPQAPAGTGVAKLPPLGLALAQDEITTREIFGARRLLFFEGSHLLRAGYETATGSGELFRYVHWRLVLRRLS
jgi:hypothetical protein